jgi:hypothetical protein
MAGEPQVNRVVNNAKAFLFVCRWENDGGQCEQTGRKVFVFWGKRPWRGGSKRTAKARTNILPVNEGRFRVKYF